MTNNTFLTSDIIAPVALATFKNNSPFLMTGNRNYEGQFDKTEYQKGDTINIRRQNHFNVLDGRIGQIQPVREESVPLVIDHQYHHELAVTSKSLTLDIDEFKERYIDPIVQEITFQAELDLAIDARNRLYLFSGAAGTPINTYQVIADTAAKMYEMAIPTNGMAYMALGPRDQAALKGSLQNSFNDVLNKSISQKGRIGRLDIFDMFMSQALARQVAGVPGAGPILVNSAGGVASGSVIPMDGFTNDTLVFTRGDIFSIAGVQSVNPVGRKDTGQDMQFVVTADTTSNGSGEANVPVSPVIISELSNPRRNVSNVIPDNGVVSPQGTHNVNVAYIMRGLDIVNPPLETIDSVRQYVQKDPATRTSLRVGFQGDILEDVNVMRIDALMGFRWHEQYAVRLIS